MRKRSSGIRGDVISAGISRRGLMLGASAAAVSVTSGVARAQTREATNWWDDIFDPTNNQRRRQPAQANPDALNDLRPDSIPWRSDEMLGQMDAAVDRYQRIVAAGGWPAIPTGRLLRPGDDDERVPFVRQRLMMTGELRDRGGYGGSYSYDGRLEEAVKQFQDRLGLRTTGRVDQPTLAQLNVSALARLEQLKLNQRRIREMLQGRIEDRYVLVNVPAFQLEAVERYETQLRHRVIVGKPDRQTPTVRATIRAVNFFPYWRVPESVATLDLIPRLIKEPEYLTKEQIRVYQGNNHELDPTSINWRAIEPKTIRFRQDPGPQNALGLVRIDMPNEHSVYMHDTPMKPLFNQRGRAFSAGCVRVQDVFQLVEWIARFENGWDRPGRVQEVLDGGHAFDVNLTRPIPVYFTYITAWAEGDGTAVFRPDIYGRDGSRDFQGERDVDAPPAPQSLAP